MDNATASDNSQRQLALRVALDTMKDRCNLQQKRLSEIEDENQELRERLAQAQKLSSSAPYNTSNGGAGGGGGVGENFQLRLQVSELQRQNTQLNSHINMVSAENRKLWSRLSQLAKDESTKQKDIDQTLTNSQICSDDISSPRGSTNQNLIRSKTFTQHSPNPNLRHKLLTGDGENQDVSFSEDKHGMNGENGIDEAVTHAAMAMGYLNVEDSQCASALTNQDQDFNVEAKKCIEGLEDMRREAVKQQQELSSALELLESTIALQPCPECAKKCEKPQMADKSLETDESLNEPKYATTTVAQQINNQRTNTEQPAEIQYASIARSTTSQPLQPASTTNNSDQLNILKDKIMADKCNKMCPMCGKVYDERITFASFCAHVEEHFIDNSIDVEPSIEQQFEIIQHAVALQPCPECAKKCEKPQMADKSLETDESLNEPKYATTTVAQQINNQTTNTEQPAEIQYASIARSTTSQPLQPASTTNNSDQLNILKDKIMADKCNKMCPMCGKVYDERITFASFCAHVEEHFIDNSIDVEPSIEQQFEIIQHAVGDF